MERSSKLSGIKSHRVLLVIGSFVLVSAASAVGTVVLMTGGCGGGDRGVGRPPSSSVLPADLLKRAQRGPVIGQEFSVTVLHPLTPTDDPLAFDFRASRSGRITPARFIFAEPPVFPASVPFQVSGTVMKLEGNTVVLTSCRVR